MYEPPLDGAYDKENFRMTFSELLLNIGSLAFVFIAVGFCIFSHELGHFLAAKWRGLHIDAFSLGFRPIWKKKVNGVEYRIGWLPFGGYVELPQVDATDATPKAADGTELPRAKAIDRIITAVAGPLFNILSGLLIACFVWYVGMPQDTPKMREITVMEVEPGSPEYQAGLRPGDKIVKLNGEPFFSTWSNFVSKILFAIGKVDLEVIRDGKPVTVSYVPVDNPKAPGSLGAEKIEDCDCIEFESVIPQIDKEDINGLTDFTSLNHLAGRFIKMSPEYRMKYKAVLSRERNFDLGNALQEIQRLDQYQLDPQVEYADEYFREYLCRHLDPKFDTRWLDDLNFMKEGQVLTERTGAARTPYGLISPPGGELYANISRRKQENIRDEKMQAVEFMDRKALFSDTRLKKGEVPEGLYRYELRDRGDGEFCSVEKEVVVNHAGTLLMKEPLDLGENGYIELDNETGLNFLGYDQTMQEFMTEEKQQEEQKGGGITQ